MKKSKHSLFRVIITGPSIAKEAMDLLSKTCHTEVIEPYPNPSELALKLHHEKTDAFIVRTGKITAEVIKASPNLKVITKHGIGVDNIDVSVATGLGIPVMITPFANYESVAEHTLGLILALSKDIPRLDSRIRQGHWDKSDSQGVELCYKTLGLIGFGRIGRRVRELVAPLQMKILVYDPFLNPDEVLCCVTRVQKIEPLLKSADIVSLHCPLTEQTRHLIGKNELKMMKKTAWLINTARGEVVDEKALISALKKGEIAAAGMDTFDKEPPENIHLLSRAGKTVLTPHVAGTTEESFKRMGVDAAKNVLTILKGEKPDKRCVVNPEVFEDE